MNRKNKTVIAVAGFDPLLVETGFFSNINAIILCVVEVSSVSA